MSDEGSAFLFGLFLGSLLSILVWCITDDSWKKELVTRGHAEYSQKTGEWQWKATADAETK